MKQHSDQGQTRKSRRLALAGLAVAGGLTAGMFAMDAAFAQGPNGQRGAGPGSGDQTQQMSQQARHNRAQVGHRAAPRGTSVTPTTTNPSAVSPVLEEVLMEAIAEERLASETYEAVIDVYGDVPPFTNIAASEARHLAALERLADKYGITIPDIEVVAPDLPGSLQEAYELGVEAETADGALYDELLPEVQDYPDVVRVLTNLQTASLDHHLPTFEAYAG